MFQTTRLFARGHGFSKKLVRLKEKYALTTNKSFLFFTYHKIRKSESIKQLFSRMASIQISQQCCSLCNIAQKWFPHLLFQKTLGINCILLCIIGSVWNSISTTNLAVNLNWCHSGKKSPLLTLIYQFYNKSKIEVAC